MIYTYDSLRYVLCLRVLTWFITVDGTLNVPLDRRRQLLRALNTYIQVLFFCICSMSLSWQTSKLLS